ncbi:alkaline phosphatase family protein [Dyadobacter sp. LHD-138]|uniref:alkaline phosphatase family protein n=1 Tax=Dyadobacter sp. LHD-138 TaxID=3071413 RepID=UPI0027DEBB07|nr:alkaline phosphatase family protein [Dyadobacter sp. LHD-138]MDQ6479348.1 alkaline phosphatase family protein [Dyadobacter sp. LHD-138]
MRNSLLIFALLACSTFSYGQKKAKNVVLISLDGYRWQEVFNGADSVLLFNKKYRSQDSAALFKKYWANSDEERREKLMPFFWNTIGQKGQLYGNRDLGSQVNVKNKYWFSYPGRSETLCGYYDPQVNSNSYPNNPNENVLEFFNKQKGYEGKVVAFASWEPVAKIVNRDRNKMLVNVPGEEVKGANLTDAQKLANEQQHYLPEYFGSEIRFDVHTYALTKSYIAANHPKVVHIDFADPDNFGHAGQYDSFLDAGHYLDAMIGNLWNTMQQDPFYKDNTVFLIYPDHGRGVGSHWTGHGTSAPRSNETWLAVIGAGIPAKGEMKNNAQIYQDQIAQTAAQLLGFKFTANHTVGEPVPTVFK